MNGLIRGTFGLGNVVRPSIISLHDGVSQKVTLPRFAELILTLLLINKELQTITRQLKQHRIDSAHAGVSAVFSVSIEQGAVTIPPKIEQGIKHTSKHGYVSPGTTMGVAAATAGLHVLELLVPKVEGAALSKFRYFPEPGLFVIAALSTILLGVWKLVGLIGVLRRRIRESIKCCCSGFVHFIQTWAESLCSQSSGHYSQLPMVHNKVTRARMRLLKYGCLSSQCLARLIFQIHVAI
jgi:hypothetical protein